MLSVGSLNTTWLKAFKKSAEKTKATSSLTGVRLASSQPLNKVIGDWKRRSTPKSLASSSPMRRTGTAFEKKMNPDFHSHAQCDGRQNQGAMKVDDESFAFACQGLAHTKRLDPNLKANPRAPSRFRNS
jgi:hypothetical protein